MTNYVLDAGLCRGRCQPGAGGSQWPGSPVWPEFVQDVIMIDGRCDNWCSNYNYQQLPGWCPLSVWSQCIWWGQSGAAGHRTHKIYNDPPRPRPPGVPVWDPPTSAGLLSSRLVAAVWTSPVAAAAVWWQLLARHCDSQDIWSRGWGQHQAPALPPDSHWACWPPWWWWGWSHLQWLCYKHTKRWKWYVNINGFRYNFGLLLFHLSYGWIGNG